MSWYARYTCSRSIQLASCMASNAFLGSHNCITTSIVRRGRVEASHDERFQTVYHTDRCLVLRRPCARVPQPKRVVARTTGDAVTRTNTRRR